MSGAGAVVVADQNKTAFQKQDTIFLGAKRVLQKKVGKKDLRYVCLLYTSPSPRD